MSLKASLPRNPNAKPRPAPAEFHSGETPLNGHATSPEDTPYGLAALRGECAAISTMPPDSGRNAAMNDAAIKMGGLIAAGKLTEATARAELAAAGRACGLGDAEIRLVLRDNANGGLTVGQATPRAVPERPAYAEVTTWLPPDQDTADEPSGDQPTEETDLATAVRENLPAIDWHALWADESEEEWIVEPILPARRLVALYSPPKVGKSLLMLEIAAAIARGTGVLGTTVDRARRVLYVDFENDPKADIRERLTDMRIGPDDLGNLIYLSFPNLAALDSDRGGRELLAAVEVYQCEVVVIDTVSRSIAGEENENDTWLNFYRHTGLRLKQGGIALIRLDHTGKDETKGQRGGSAKSGDIDAVWRMSEVVKDTTYRLDCEANRMPITEKTIVIHRRTGPLVHQVDSQGRAAALQAKVDAVVAAMDAAGLPREVTNQEAREVVRAAGVRAGNEAIRRGVDERRLRFG